jgi:hypothetical protein
LVTFKQHGDDGHGHGSRYDADHRDGERSRRRSQRGHDDDDDGVTVLVVVVPVITSYPKTLKSRNPTL